MELAVDFTKPIEIHEPTICGRDKRRCPLHGSPVLPGDPMFFVQSNAGDEGRKVCSVCYDYYTNQQTSVIRGCSHVELLKGE